MRREAEIKFGDEQEPWSSSRFSILQKHAFWTIRKQKYNPIVQKNAYLKNRKEEWQGIIVKNAILLIIDLFYFLIIVKNGVLLIIKNNDFFITFYLFLRIDK